MTGPCSSCRTCLSATPSADQLCARKAVASPQKPMAQRTPAASADDVRIAPLRRRTTGTSCEQVTDAHLANRRCAAPRGSRLAFTSARVSRAQCRGWLCPTRAVRGPSVWWLLRRRSGRVLTPPLCFAARSGISFFCPSRASASDLSSSVGRECCLIDPEPLRTVMPTGFRHHGGEHS
jgi:hypothetical protein